MLEQQNILLRDWTKASPLKVESFLLIAIMLTEMINKYHQKNEIIGMFSTDNIIINFKLYRALVTEAEKWNEAYRAPEYIGAFNRNPDGRSDLYTLGIIFYELLTGKIPFHLSPQKYDWAYIHYVESPQSLSTYPQNIPPPIQDMVMKLLQKSPDARYQSALGLIADLKQCSERLAENGNINELTIGTIDKKAQFLYPNQLVGRENVLTQLAQYYGESQAGISRLVYIHGVEGIGKTTLLQACMTELSANHAHIMTAASQSNSSTLYGVIFELIGIGFERLWSEPYTKIISVRDKLERELGDRITYLWTLFPEAAQHLGLYPRQVNQQAIEDEHTGQVLLSLLGTLIEMNNPVVLFIDQLEYADVQSIALLKRLAASKQNFSVLCIAALRTENMNRYHPEAVVVEDLLIEQIELQPLKYDEVRDIVSSVISENTMRGSVLARILLDSSGGNSRVIRETLEQWKLKKKIVFCEKDYRWTWEKLLIENSIDPIIDARRLYERGFLRLSSLAQQALVAAAAIGVKFDSHLLADIIKESHASTISILKEAELEGMIIREDTFSQNDTGVTYFFINKGLQQSIYEHDRSTTTYYHYEIGYFFAEIISEKQDEQHKIEQLIVYHWNHCVEKLSDEQKHQFTDFILHIIKQSNIKREHHEARELALVSIRLLEELQEGIARIAAHYLELAYSEYMLGNTEQAQYYFNDLMKHAHNMERDERIILGMYQTQMFTLADNEDALRNGNVVLKEYGWEVPGNVNLSTLLLEIVKTKRLLHKIRVNKNLPSINHDQDYMRFCKVIIDLSVTLLFVDPMRQIVLLSRFIQHGLKHGSNEYVFIAVGIYELILIRAAPAFLTNMSHKSYSKLTKTVDINSITNYRLHLMNGLYHQLEGPEVVTGNVMRSIRSAVEAGSMSDANLAMIILLASYYGDLYQLKDIHTYLQDEVSLYIDDKTAKYLDMSINYYEAMQNQASLELFAKQGMSNRQQVQDSCECLHKVEASYLAGLYEEAMNWVMRGKELTNSYDWLPYRRIRIYEALCYAAMYRDAAKTKRRQLKQEYIKIHKEMRRWSDFYGRNSSCFSLITAEWYGMNGNTKAAIQYYEKAIQQANAEKYYIIEAIANERLYHLYTVMNSRTSAGIALIDAYSGYSKWGIMAKVNQFKAMNPQLVMVSTLLSSEAQEESEHLLEEAEPDILTTKRYIQPDSEKFFLSQMFHWDLGAQSEQTISRFLHIALSQLGADRGYLVSCDEGHYELELQVGRQLEVESIPLHICRYVNITGQPLILNDVVHTHYVKDSYIYSVQPASLICIKMGKHQDNKSWLIYIENSLITNMFTERSLHILDMMVMKLTYIHWMNNEKSNETSEGSLNQNKQMLQLVEVESQLNMTTPLTQREYEVLAALTDGLSNKEIGETLGISEATVKTHLVNIYSKLGVKRRGQAIAKANELNLIVS